eukprot:918118_1
MQSNEVSIILKKIPLPLYNAIKIADTLQGSIWRASTNPTTTKTVVVKLTDRNQHNQSISIINNTVHHDIAENILTEQRILQYLSSQSIAKHIAFFKTDNWYILVQEDGGNSLFEFVRKAHALIQSDRLDITHWKEVVKIILRKLIQCIEFIHSRNVCHHDISLGNILINDMSIAVQPSGKIKLILTDIKIKLCDFGLAHLYNHSTCLSSNIVVKGDTNRPRLSRVRRRLTQRRMTSGVWAFACSYYCLVALRGMLRTLTMRYFVV